MVPGVVPVERVVGRNDEVAVYIASLQVYESGLTFELLVLGRTPERGDGPLGGGRGFGWSGLGPETPAGGLRLGVAFADGRRATARDDVHPDSRARDRVRLLPQGGGGSDTFHHVGMWVAPLPPEGPFAIVCDWPDHGLPESRCVIDGAIIAAAAARSQTLFSEDHLLPWDTPGEPDDEDGTDGGGWARYVPVG